MKFFSKKSILIYSLVLLVLVAGTWLYFQKYGRFSADVIAAVNINGSIDRETFDPIKESLGLTWQIGADADTVVYVRKANTRQTVAVVYRAANQKAGSYSSVWNGTNDNRYLVAAGDYHLVYQATLKSNRRVYRAYIPFKILDTAEPVSVNDNSNTDNDNSANANTNAVVTNGNTNTAPSPNTNSGTVVPSTNELGFIAEGSARANFDVFKNGNSTKFGAIFKATKTGAINRFAMAWKSASGYGVAPYGTWTFELRENGADNFPGNLMGSVTGLSTTASMTSSNGDWFYIPLKANLVEGKSYHLVAINTGSGWSSVNTIMTRPLTWPGGIDVTPRGECYQCYGSGNKWQPWGSIWSAWSVSSNAQNAVMVPIVFEWQDGSVTGFPFTSNRLDQNNSGTPTFAKLSNKIGEYITWNNETTSISQIGVLVAEGSNVSFDLFDIAANKSIKSGDLTVEKKSSDPEWWSTKLTTPVTLEKGKKYALWFSGSGVAMPFYDPQGAKYDSISWGGAESYFIMGSVSTTYKGYDLPISLKK